MKHFIFNTSGTCSRKIEFDIDDDGMLRNVKFDGGCHGNLQGISRLTEGQPAQKVAEIIAGVDCRQKGTSCPDQLAKAIRSALSEA